MTLEDAPADSAPRTRRSVRAETGDTPTAAPVASTAEMAPVAPTTPAAPVAPAAPAAPVALAWLQAGTVLSSTYAPRDIDLRTATPAAADLLADAPRHAPFRPSTLIPLAAVIAVLAAYVVTALSWPLNAVPPQIAAVQVQPAAAAAAAPAFPAKGSASVAVEGISTPLASTTKTAPIASITKLVTALLVLDEMPLSVGEQGPKFSFRSSDYGAYLASGQSALKVPVGKSLTEYQLLEGMLIGSANNYADRLAGELWPTDAVYAAAAKSYLASHGIKGITVVNPSGFDSDNKATPAALIALAQKALANPVIAQIVATKSVKLPGAGTVKNTNKLLADPGVVGLKTGTLSTYDNVTAKDVKIGDTTVRMYASVLGQPSDAARVAASRALYAQLEKELALTPSVPAGTSAGEVTTAWGETVDVVTADDASVVVWNGAQPAATVALNLADKDAKGDVVGSLTVTGPLDSAKVDLTLSGDVEGPTAWWRITHPLELFGVGR